MPPRALAEISTFDQLRSYLEEELEWPMDDMDIDDLTFDYDPEEDLGLDPTTAAKIKFIKQLRQLDSVQPFGIFFVQFDRKKLPVVAMRRILGRLVSRKRESANPADRKTWEQDDLLFISAYGEDETRRLDFAHFADDAENGLPTLRVLGWDTDDTDRKLEWVERQLRTQLTWPDELDPDEWRQQWRSAFILRNRQVIDTSKKLAQELAVLAQRIRSRVITALNLESPKGPLRTLHKAFRESLIHDLEPDDFADMYAQTIAYGLLSARVSRPTDLVADNLADMVPVTNPFLKELMETFLNVGGRKWSGDKGKLVGIDFDELGVNEVVDTLREANMEAVLRDFDNRNPQEDPVLHFYEHFLKEYDAQKRMQRGVFYTPKPVVSYIVRSVHELLQTEFGLPLGLADTTTWGEMAERDEELTTPEGVSPDSPFVQIPDPATGTATFLVEVMDLIHKTMIGHWQSEGVRGELFLKQKWNEYVPRQLLPRLHGYELMMAPYAIAHMKIGLKLSETGYAFEDDERARVYLTNALEPAQDFSDTFEQMAPALAHEAQAVNDVKQHQRFTVIIGNPPYSKSMSKSPASLSLTSDFKREIKEKKSDLNREEWKFLRLGYRFAEASSAGIVGYVINNAFLSAPTHRGIRKFLLEIAQSPRIIDLHGDSKKGDQCPDGGQDENVFEIQQGVCIAVGVVASGPALGRISKCDLFGSRIAKYGYLLKRREITNGAKEFSPKAPFYFFREEKSSHESIYQSWLSLPEWFQNSNTGIQTKNDELFTAIDLPELRTRISEVLENISTNYDAICSKYGLRDSAGWKVSKLKGISFSDDGIRPFLYKPFDHRYIYYHNTALGRARYSTMRHMLHPNVGLVATRQVTRLPYSHAFVSRWPIEEKTGSHDRTTQLYPLYLYPDEHELAHSTGGHSAISPAVATALALKLEVSDLHPEHVLNYIYGILYSPQYRKVFGHQLLGDFPRIPFPMRFELFDSVGKTGEELMALHLLESPTLDKSNAAYCGSSGAVVEKVSYVNQTVWLDKAKTRGFTGVPEEVWNFHIGGYQVCHKWLKDRQAKGGRNPRPGRVLTDDDIAHYCKIVTAIHHTIRIMGEIDEVIEAHGGWPDAFVTEPMKECRDD